MCNSRKYPYSPTEGIGISQGVGGSLRPKHIKHVSSLNWNFQRGCGRGWEKPSLGGGRDISETIQLHKVLQLFFLNGVYNC